MKKSEAENLARWIETLRPVRADVCSIAEGLWAVALFADRVEDDCITQDVRFAHSRAEALALAA